MKRLINTESQVMELFKEYEEGKHTAAKICRMLAISIATFHKWHQRYGSGKDNKGLTNK